MFCSIDIIYKQTTKKKEAKQSEIEEKQNSKPKSKNYEAIEKQKKENTLKTTDCDCV